MTTRSRSSRKDPVSIVVETPRGSANKYKFSEKSGRIMLSKVMPQGMMFPHDFGFVPGTRTEDGDPLDVLLLSDEPTFPGCEVESRLIGVLRANQTEHGKTLRNDRVLAVATASVLYAGVHEIADLEPALLSQIEQFFVNYQKVRDIVFEVVSREGAEAAHQVLEQAVSHHKSRSAA